MEGKENEQNNIYDLTRYEKKNNPRDIFNVLLRRNFNHLLRSKHSIFSRGPVLDKCGWFAEGDGVEELLQGRSDTETMSKKYPEFQKEAKAFLDAIQKPIDQNTQFTPRVHTVLTATIF